jgi:hypothetical protein
MGQVRPQTGNWWFEGPVWASRDNEMIQVLVQQSLFHVRIDTDGPDDVDNDWIERVWLRSLAVLRAALDTLGFHRGASLEIERLTGLIDDRQVLFFGPSQPRFQTSDDEHVEAEVIGAYFSEAVQNPSFRHALADVRQAHLVDDDAAFHCYRAIEGLRQSFVLSGESEKTDKVKSWERLRSALNVTEEQIGACRRGCPSTTARWRRHVGSRRTARARLLHP